MNGRIYDPTLGRFLQADPHIQAPENSQSYNRYAYVLNNPLSYTDPSGYFFSKLWKKIKPFIGAIAAVVVSIYCQVCGATMWNAAMTGAAIGAGSAAINGGNILKGALIGAFSGAAFQQIGANFNGAEGSGFFAEGGLGHIAAHGIAGGVTSVLQGGKFGHGFLSAGLTKALNVNNLIGTAAKHGGLRVAVAAVVGGTISKVTGGKFANGAITAAFAQAFNGERAAKVAEAKKMFMAEHHLSKERMAAILTLIESGVSLKSGADSQNSYDAMLATLDRSQLIALGHALKNNFRSQFGKSFNNENMVQALSTQYRDTHFMQNLHNTANLVQSAMEILYVSPAKRAVLKPLPKAVKTAESILGKIN